MHKHYTNITLLESRTAKSGNSERRGIFIPRSPLSAKTRSPLSPGAKTRSPGAKKNVPPPRQTSSMTQREIVKNLTIRGIRASGVWEDDRETLQREFFKEYKTRLKAAIIAARVVTLENEGKSTRQIIINQVRETTLEKGARIRKLRSIKKAKDRANKLSMSEEYNALKRRPDLKRWLDLVAQNKCEPDAVFRMRPILCRVVIKGLPPVSCLRSLKLSSNQLTDSVGPHISNMLRSNKSLTKLDLSGNLLGPSGIAQLGAALQENHTLRSLNLSKNPITVGNNGQDLAGVKVSDWIVQIKHTIIL